MKILPIIYNTAEQTVSKDYLIEQFKKEGLTIESISTENIGTGTEIKASDGITYTVLIYGDVDGDGCVDAFDAGAIIKHYVFGNELTGIYKLASMLDDDEEIDAFDAGRITQFFIGNRQDLVSNKPVSDKEKDSINPEITLKGDSTVTIKLGSTYTDAGATAKDNVDGDITEKIKVNSNVDTSKIGTYTVTYSVMDNARNTATITRTVNVIDYVSSITIKAPNKTEYTVGSKIDLTGGTITMHMASGELKTIDMTSDMISGFDSSASGRKTITVSYEGQIATFYVSIINDTSNTENTGNTGNTSNKEDTENKGNTSNKEDTENKGNTGNKEDTENTENTGNTGNTGNKEDTENNGNTGNTEESGNKEETKEISKIIIEPSNNTSAYIYDKVTATVKSGENEKAININDLNIKIERIEVDKTKTEIKDNSATVEKNVVNGNVTINFVANKEGKYRITASVGNINNYFDIEASENRTVTDIEISSADNNVATKGKVKNYNLTFKHIYANKEESILNKYIDLADISVTSTDENAKISKTMDNENIVVSIIPSVSGNITLSVKLGNAVGTENMQVQDNKFTVNEIMSGEKGTINLYVTEPTSTDGLKDIYLVVDEYDDEDNTTSTYIYTLIPVTIGQDKIQYVKFRNGNIEVVEKSDLSDLEEELPAIKYVCYQFNSDTNEYRKITNGQQNVDYIGIAITDPSANITSIEFTNKDTNETVVLDVNMIQ